MSDGNIDPNPDERGPNPLRWVIYSTFDPIGALQQFALDQVIAYSAAGAFILVVDTSPQLSAERAKGWDDHASAWFQRENEGYDMMSYSAGLRWIQNRMSISSYSIVLTNDSCYGPFFSIECILKRIEENKDRENTVFGITDSYETDYHLQSYFLYFGAGTRELLSQFFGKLGKITNREDAILNGEIALSRFLRAQNTRMQAICPISSLKRNLSFARYALIAELVMRRCIGKYKYDRHNDTRYLNFLTRGDMKNEPINQSLLAGAELVRRKLSPFVKRSVFRDGFFYKSNFCGRCWRSDTLTNDEVYFLLAHKNPVRSFLELRPRRSQLY